ncbi:MAG: dTDP-4-dehydrorhamnose 3,5-epimerase family protein [Verrucomicrobiota bacterium]
MIIHSEPLPGTFLLLPKIFNDSRGTFIKTYHAPSFEALGIPFLPLEEFFSISHKGALRGMHFQMPPHDHEKLAYCFRGSVLDVLLDLRRSSPTYGKCASVVLSGENRLQLFVPKGVAHGFLSLEDESVMVYTTSTIHMPAHDAGILWNSFGFDWPDVPKILSGRDLAHPAFGNFDSPFA